MPLGLSSHIHAAISSDRVVTLDMRDNRYRLYTGRRAAVLAALGRGDDIEDEEAVHDLLSQRILDHGGCRIFAASIQRPLRGALEQRDTCEAHIPLAGMAAAACQIALRMTAGSFRNLLHWARPVGWPCSAAHDESLIAWAHAFERSRLHVPLHRNCLRDALLMARLLSRRAIDCRLVLGVRLDPFGAHSWVQAGDLVLTGSLGVAREMTPILVR